MFLAALEFLRNHVDHPLSRLQPMSETLSRDFQEILAQPVLAYEEGLRFFRGQGLMNEALSRIARDLPAHGIAYCVIGAVALNQHGYHRLTVDIDLLLTPEGAQRFAEELVGPDYQPGGVSSS